MRVFNQAVSARRESARLVIAFSIASLLACAAAAIVASVVYCGSKAADIGALRAMFLESYWNDIRPEPVERAAWLAGTAAVFPASLLALTVVRKLRDSEQLAALCAPLLSLLAVLFCAPFVGSDLMGDLLRGDPANPVVHGPHFLVWFLVPASAIIAIFLIRHCLDAPQTPDTVFLRLRRQITRHGNGLCFLMGVAVVLSAAALRIRTAAIVGGDPHFEPVLYSVSQVTAGKTLLADLPAQYGLYAEMLHPVFALLGLSVLKFTLLLTALQAIAALALASAVAAQVRSKGLRILLVLSLCWIVGSTWTSVYMSPLGYEYFQVWPIRFLFPAISVWLYLRAHRTGFTGGRVAALAAVAGLALVWNLDSGVPTAGALIACMLVRAIFATDGQRRRNLMLLAIALLVPVLVATLFLSYLAVEAHGGFQLQDWIKYQSIFYQSGFGMLPLPRYPHPWMAILGLYLFAIAGGIFAHLRARPTAPWDGMLYLGVLGTGLLTYYQGRSHVVVLTLAMWPAIPIAVILADRTLRAARVDLLSRWVGWTAVPAVVFGVLMSLLWMAAMPKLIFMTAKEAGWATIYRHQTRNVENIAFIKSRTIGARQAAIIDPAQAVYFTETGLASEIKGPGIGEMYLAADRQRMLVALGAEPVAHLFIGLDEDGKIPAPYRSLLARYRPLATSSAGLQYLEPRPFQRYRPSKPINRRK